MQQLVERLQQWRKRVREDQKGVTLIELLAVVVILAIIAAVGVPVVMGQINKSKVSTDKSNEQIIIDALKRAELDYQTSQNGSIWISQPGTIVSSSGATVTEGTSTAQDISSLLTSGYTGSSNNGGYLDGIPSPQTGTVWNIVSGTQTPSGTQPVATFTYANSATGATGTFSIYPS